MAVIDGRTWLEHLGPDECWRLLRETPVGRIGVLVDSAPEIYPVNHLVDGDTILFRTGPGSKLRGLDRSPAVCYQVDDIDPGTHTGWSVLVKGRASPLSDAGEIRRVTGLPLEHWSVGPQGPLGPHRRPPGHRPAHLARHRHPCGSRRRRRRRRRRLARGLTAHSRSSRCSRCLRSSRRTA